MGLTSDGIFRGMADAKVQQTPFAVMNMLLLKSILPLAASSVALVCLPSCNKSEDGTKDPDGFSMREPGIGPTKSTGDGRPIYPEPPAAEGDAGAAQSGNGQAGTPGSPQPPQDGAPQQDGQKPPGDSPNPPGSPEPDEEEPAPN